MSQDKLNTLDNAKAGHFRLLGEEWTQLNERADREKILEDVNCPVGCEDAGRQIFYKNKTRFVKCPRCGLVYINPQLTNDALVDHFRNSPAWKIWAEDVLPHPDQLLGDLDKYRSALALFDELHVPNRWILDVGANAGIFLGEAQKERWQIDGIEPSTTAAAIAGDRLGIPVFNGYFEDFSSEPGRYGVICFWASLEYHKRPREALEKAKSLLAPGGILLAFISGNSHSLVMRTIQQHWKGWLFNRLWYFTPRCLAAMAGGLGLELIEQHSVIPALDAIEQFIGYSNPENDDDANLFGAEDRKILSDLIIRNDMGYKFQAVFRKAAD